MINIKKDNSIELTRGDSLILKLTLRQNNRLYTPEEGEEIRFALGTNYLGEANYKLVLKKTIPIDTLILELTPAETKDLSYDIDYKYDIQITHLDGSIDTFISGIFQVIGEVE